MLTFQPIRSIGLYFPQGFGDLQGLSRWFSKSFLALLATNDYISTVSRPQLTGHSTVFQASLLGSTPLRFLVF